MHYWVNQGKTYKQEKEGGYLWAPTQNNFGNTLFHWSNMTRLEPNDVILNYFKGSILGYCIVQSKYFIAPKPKELNVDVEWENQGFMVDAKYFLFSNPVELKTAYPMIEEYLPPKYSPINNSGTPPKIKANQGYLYESNEMVTKEVFKIAGNYYYFESKLARVSEPEPIITTKQGIITSRVGQGEYRQRILQRWNFECAVIKSQIKEILIASHIVPWRDATDKERLDVDNGLLLSPTYDALFDRNLISFDNNGNILLSSSIKSSEFKKLGVTGKEKIDNLTEGNKRYLVHHRQKLVSI